MADTIGSLAYRIKLDSTQFKEGLVATRAELSAAKKITEAMKQPFDRLALATENLDVLQKKNLITLAQRKALEKELEKDYLTQESAIRKLNKAEQERLNMLRRGPDGRRSKEELAEIHRVNREKGLAEQQRLREQNERYGKAVEQETQMARKALQQRLELYKQEKAARMAAMASNVKGPMQGPTFQGSNTFASKPAETSSGGGMGGGFAFGAKAFAGAMVVNEMSKAGAAMKQFVADSQAVFASNERLAASFDVFTGSEAKTRALTEQMKSLSAMSGVSLSALGDGAANMLSYGVTVEEVTDKMKQMAAISRGDPERFKSMALAYAQVAGAGKLMGQENLQLINSGFAPLAEISRTTGRSIADLRKDMEAGLITTKMVADAFASATSEGGRYNGMLEKIGETTSGAQSKSQAAWDQAKNDVGEALAPLTRWRAEASEFFAKDISQLAGLFKQTAAPPPEEKPDPRAAGRERAAAEKARVEKALKEQADAREAMRTSGLQRLDEMQGSTNMDKIKGFASKEELERFNDLIGLMDEATKATATEDFAAYGNIETIYSYLDKSVALRLKEVEALKEQNRQYAEMKAKSDELKSSAESLKEKYASSAEKLKQQLVDLEVMRGSGMISNDVYNKARNDAAMEATADQRQKITQANALPASIAAGSQEAYKLMVENKNRASTGKQKEAEKQIALAKDHVAVAKESKAILKELNDKLNFKKVG